MKLPSPRVLATLAVAAIALAVALAFQLSKERKEHHALQSTSRALQVERDQLSGKLRQLEQQQAALENVLTEQNRQLDAITRAMEGKKTDGTRPDTGWLCDRVPCNPGERVPKNPPCDCPPGDPSCRCP